MKLIPLRQSDEDMVRMFRALGHPARLSIVRLLMERQQCVCGDLVDELPLAQATVSQHLKVLKEAGIIIGEVAGPATKGRSGVAAEEENERAFPFPVQGNPPLPLETGQFECRSLISG